MKEIELILDGLVNVANKGGALSASAILFLICMLLIAHLHKEKQLAYAETMKRLEAWMEASKAEEHQTAAINKLADGFKTLSEGQNNTATQVAVLVALIKDRKNGGVQ